jgi:hypothetical protein
MTAPTVKARSSVEIDNSCNGPFCCFGHRKHRKRSPLEKKVTEVVTANPLQIAPPAKPIERRSSKDETQWADMPPIINTDNPKYDVKNFVGKPEGSK